MPGNLQFKYAVFLMLIAFNVSSPALRCSSPFVLRPKPCPTPALSCCVLVHILYRYISQKSLGPPIVAIPYALSPNQGPLNPPHIIAVFRGLRF